MHTMRPRHYVPRRWLAIARPVFRYSQIRDAYVLRGVGRKWGPVLKEDRRHSSDAVRRPERRGSRARVA